MPHRKRNRDRVEITFNDACDVLEAALAGGTRAEMLDAISAAEDGGAVWQTLRSAMRSHTFVTSGEPLALQRIVHSFDARTRQIGFHAIESWDYRAHRFANDITPVLMLDQCGIASLPQERRRGAVAVLLDHYFASVLGLFATHAWDGDPNANFDRIDGLLAALQGEHGSGRHFADDAETLLLMAISHYHPEETAYDTLLARTGALDDLHRRRLALATAAALGGHLRWGLRFMYRRDVGLMRDDNVVDYPWLTFALAALMRDYERLSPDDAARDALVETLLNGISPDPWFVTGTRSIGNNRDADHAELRELVLSLRGQLMADFHEHQPVTASFTPLGFSCNFLCNTMTAMVATALPAAERRPSVNALFTRRAEHGEREAKTLMAYAVDTAQRTGGAALIVYDPHDAAHAFNVTMGVLKGA